MLLTLSLLLRLSLDACWQLSADSSDCGTGEAGFDSRRRFDCADILGFRGGAANCCELAIAEPVSRMPISRATSGSFEAASASPSNIAVEASSSESGLQRCTGKSSKKIGFCRVIAAAAAVL